MEKNCHSVGCDSLHDTRAKVVSATDVKTKENFASGCAHCVFFCFIRARVRGLGERNGRNDSEH